MRRAFCLGVALLATTSAGARPLPTPASVRAQIARHGARPVVDRLDRSGVFDRILDQIEAGRTPWIELAPLLAQGTDGAYGEGLSIELARGLVRSPAAVLAVLHLGDGPEIDTEVARVCDVPFIEPPPGYDEAYLRRALRALATVRNPQLAAIKAACLKQLTAPDG